MRAHEGWAATIHKTHLTFTDMLSPGTYTLWFYRSVAAGSGNEVNAIQINASGSTIVINSERYTGGGGTGTDTFLELTDTPAAFGTAGQSLRVNTARNQLEFYTPASGGGLTQSQVDARVGALVENFAEVGNAATIPTGKVANLGITEAKLASNAVSERTIQDDAVRAAQIQAGAVGTSELADDAVVRAKIGAGAVGATELGTNAVTQAKLADDAVGADELASNAVVTASIVDDAVTLDKIANAVVSRLLPSGGANDEVLTKSSASDYAVEWAASGGNPPRVLKTFTPWEDTPIASITTNIRTSIIGNVALPSSVGYYLYSAWLQLPADFRNREWLVLQVDDTRGTSTRSPFTQNASPTFHEGTFQTSFGADQMLTGATATLSLGMTTGHATTGALTFTPSFQITGTPSGGQSPRLYTRIKVPDGSQSDWLRRTIQQNTTYTVSTYFTGGVTVGPVTIEARLGYESGGTNHFYSNVPTQSAKVYTGGGWSGLEDIWLKTDAIPTEL